jgi:hypothetical protein
MIFFSKTLAKVWLFYMVQNVPAFLLKLVMGEMSASTCCRRVSSDKIEKMVLALNIKILRDSSNLPI